MDRGAGKGPRQRKNSSNPLTSHPVLTPGVHAGRQYRASVPGVSTGRQYRVSMAGVHAGRQWRVSTPGESCGFIAD